MPENENNNKTIQELAQEAKDIFRKKTPEEKAAKRGERMAQEASTKKGNKHGIEVDSNMVFKIKDSNEADKGFDELAENAAKNSRIDNEFDELAKSSRQRHQKADAEAQKQERIKNATPEAFKKTDEMIERIEQERYERQQQKDAKDSGFGKFSDQINEERQNKDNGRPGPG